MRREKVGLSDWHLFNRGSRRMALFHDDQDSRVFLARLRKAAGVSGVVVWAYVLMTNHFHLVVRADSEQLARFTHHLQRLYSLYHNQRWGLTGHAIAGPYGAVRQLGGAMLLRTLAYVFLNPVAARQCKDPEDWEWTSYRSFMGMGDAWRWMDPMPLLTQMMPDPDRTRRRLLETLQDARERLGRNRVSKEQTATEVHAHQFEWLIERARAREADLDGHDPVLLAVVWAREVGILYRAIARDLGGPLSGAKRMELCRFRDWLAADPLRWERLQIP
jgi:hypothetical protein